ncbi:MAG: DUF177 domain-containing protein [Bacteroidota bacterium]
MRLFGRTGAMDVFRNYKIDIFGLKNGTHQYDFSFDEDFFSKFESSLLKLGKGSCKVQIEKTSSMLTLDFEVVGDLTLECDRSLELFEYPISIEKELIFKYGDEEKELSEEVFVITPTTQSINIASFLYEIIHLEIPMKKLHPKFKNEDAEDELIFSSTVSEPNQDTVDPRWEALKKLNKN